MNDFYVYVYIDPRNYEEFYYGKMWEEAMTNSRKKVNEKIDIGNGSITYLLS